ncbi:hypothetical protein C1646_664904 [Rhizophagus diaphanus]|nr:hypothetical protein C1646_664904 [Rhizophagus diaphanus] [Rhizophagus sp. MUCL 43196]
MPKATKTKSIKRHRQHIHWNTEEDNKLKELAIKYNKKKWKLIAGEMKTRDAKQCRERYFGHLEEGINKHPLSIGEDSLILELRNIENPVGWALIASKINETFNLKRTANQIKNNYNQRLSKLDKEKSPFKTHDFFDNNEQKFEFTKCSDEQVKPHDFKCSEKQTQTIELYKLDKFPFSGFNNNINITSQVEMKIVENPKNYNYNNQQTPIPIEYNKMSISYLIHSIST